MHRWRCQFGFSLLELIIVLVVMVGLIAIVWPNLQRPLSRTRLDEAAQIVRSAIDETRYQAMLAGTPWFVKLQIGDSAVAAGTFDAFVEASPQSDLLSSKGASSEMDPSTSGRADYTSRSGPNFTRTPALRSWKLPDQVVIAGVQWQLVGGVHRFHTSSETYPLDSLDNNSDPEDVFSIEDATDFSSLSNSLPASPPPVGKSELHWLPILSSGRGRDATIVLWDRGTRQMIQVVFIAATGAMEVLR
ncbi:MAG: type II secretion system GspH family protein [bacterium]|nr:type II secretion system GspH family protein [bacterium]